MPIINILTIQIKLNIPSAIAIIHARRCPSSASQATQLWPFLLLLLLLQKPDRIYATYHCGMFGSYRPYRLNEVLCGNYWSFICEASLGWRSSDADQWLLYLSALNASSAQDWLAWCTWTISGACSEGIYDIFTRLWLIRWFIVIDFPVFFEVKL